MKIITFIFSFLILINIVFSNDPTIVRFEKPTIDTYASDSCSPIIDVLINFDGLVNPQHYNFKTNNEAGISFPSIINGSLYLFNIQHQVPIGKNQPVSFQLEYSSVRPSLIWNFTNYATIDCDPIPTTLTMQAKQDKWVSTKGLWSLLYWQKLFVVNGLEKSLPYDGLVCTVPQPFYCIFSQTLNGQKVINFLFQIVIYKNPTPYTPFNVVISDKQGRVLHSSPFDGLESPSNPPISISSSEIYPKNGSIAYTDMLKSSIYNVNILNKNGICGIENSNNYYVQNTLIPVLGNPSNASYIGFTELNGNGPVSSHLHIVDTEGTKRIGSDNIAYIGKRSYDTIIENLKSVHLEDTHTNNTIVNLKADVSYFENAYISSNILQNRVLLRYPFGYSNGTVGYHSVSVSLPVPRAKSNVDYLYFRVGTDTISNNIDITPSNITDNTIPQLLKVETIFLEFERVLTRVHARDLESGIGFLYFTNLLKVTSADLVYGDIYDGVYEKVEQIGFLGGSTKPSINIYDVANNYNQFYSSKAIFDTNFNMLPDYPSIKYAEEYHDLDPFTFSAFEFKQNDVDVSNGPVNNTLCFNFAGSSMNMIPRFYLFPSPLNMDSFKLDDLTENLGSWNSAKGMFCLDFQIPARLFTGDVLYSLIMYPVAYESYYLINAVGEKAQLRVKSNFADQMPPIITEFATYPSNNVEITENTNIGWNIRIEDSPNGFKSAEFNITSDFDLEPYILRLTPTNATSGNANSGTYQLRIPIKANTCRSQSFRISSASITDTQGHTSLLPSKLNVNPLMKFLDSPHLTLNITCPQAIVDNIPPVLTSFSPSVDTIEVGVYKDFRNITFTFTTSDYESGISTRHIPVVYITAKNFDREDSKEIFFDEQISQVAKLSSYIYGVATYTCTIQLAYGYGSYQGILVSVYGIVDNQLNINGYSTTDLQSLGFQGTIKVTYSNNPVLDTTSAINSTGTSLTIYGHKFGIDSTKITLQVDYQNGQGWKNTPLSFFSGIILMTNSITPTSTPFYVRVIVDDRISNSLLVVPTGGGNNKCNYEIIQTITSQWNNSHIYPYTLTEAIIKNKGSKPITSFNFTMNNIDQIWGVDKDTATEVYRLPSWHSIINPFEQYSFGYIVKSLTVGIFDNVKVEC
ncbi:hypothetical protein DICPUDRAFT_33217 [Dictyostelium purpureum]|uniref:Carbohydrate binding domain-containing protein n=1 Tax=Dictyostelium purpureum TaxID=5786 RepID=F0ZKF9_DICPU|nr:uncharacterized protein DICPUDRAFT_33217 [Dictyostelium purpureum]EGC35587.1 hypothetical protein DICPUDRAFT_33217 [Dictyostelium purpureum]|eukprot:XP_003287890.1 hypothetical protein DICPUDRAFT_33217 [Dictyostelium purpureum]